MKPVGPAPPVVPTRSNTVPSIALVAVLVEVARHDERHDPGDVGRHPVVVNDDDVGRLGEGFDVRGDLLRGRRHERLDVLVLGRRALVGEERIAEPVDREVLDLGDVAVEHDRAVHVLDRALERPRVVVPAHPDVRKVEVGDLGQDELLVRRAERGRVAAVDPRSTSKLVASSWAKS